MPERLSIRVYGRRWRWWYLFLRSPRAQTTVLETIPVSVEYHPATHTFRVLGTPPKRVFRGPITIERIEGDAPAAIRAISATHCIPMPSVLPEAIGPGETLTLDFDPVYCRIT